MPFANNGALCIHYEVEGVGPPLLLHHGTTGSGGIWRDLGFVDRLRDDYQDDPASYELYLRVSDVTAVLNDLKLQTSHYLSRPPANGRWKGLFAWDEGYGGEHAGKIDAHG
jgi:pimeloyl-ACP methyl ester carboxylesterase